MLRAHAATASAVRTVATTYEGSLTMSSVVKK
jgi:hypothetical protein